MKRFRFLGPIGLLLITAIFSAIVMLLWNWLMPVIFSLGTINFLQALGLFVLARILFGGFGWDRGKMMGHTMNHHDHGNHIREKWMKMTPEQRKEFIRRRQRFGFDFEHPHPFDRGHFDMEGHEEEDGRKDE